MERARHRRSDSTRSTASSSPSRRRQPFRRLAAEQARHGEVGQPAQLAFGLSAGAAAYFAGPWLAATAGGIGGFATSLAVQFGMALRRLLATAHAR